jgi:hypothetical protein
MNMRSILAPLLIASSLAFAPGGQAGTHTWTGAAANGLWSTPSNWEGSNPLVGGGTLRVNSTQPIARYDVTTPGYLGGIGSVYNVTMRGGYLDLGNVIAGPDGLMQYVDADMANYPHRFYRFAAP